MTGGETPDPSPAASEPTSSQSHWGAGRIIAMVFASFGALVGLAALVAGIGVLIAFAAGRDDDGYFTTDRERLASATYAITTEEIDLGADEIDWAPEGILGNVRLRVDGGETPVFVGIGPDEDVDSYLGEVTHDELIDFSSDPEMALADGGAPSAPPGEQEFWVAQSEGAGDQQLVWDADFGRWTAVVMNADAADGIDVEADAAIKLDWAVWAGLGMLIFGLLFFGGAVAAILLIGRGASRPRQSDPAAPEPPS